MATTLGSTTLLRLASLRVHPHLLLAFLKDTVEEGDLLLGAHGV